MATQTKTKTKKQVAPPNVLNVAFVWDMSGSMDAIFGATKEGTQGYLLDLQKEERKLIKKHGEGVYTRLSLTIFDTVFEPWVVDTPILDVDVKKLVNEYIPRGGTALYDAIARTVTQLSNRENEKFLVVVMTDGRENSSQEYSLRNDGKKKLFNLVKRYEKKGNWTFVYLGANVDAYSEAAAIGIPAGNAAYYATTGGSVAAASAGMSNITRTLSNSNNTSTSTAFADAGESNDYRDES